MQGLSNIKIAYLILAHTDPYHIARLANKLSSQNRADVYIHVDNKVDISPFKELLRMNQCVTFIEKRVSVNWGGYSSVEATLALMESAYSQKKYHRFIILQGLDYPLVSNREIYNFFEENNDVEFIRACKITGSDDKYHTRKYECYWFYDNFNLLKKVINKINTLLPVKIRKGCIKDSNSSFDIYWGSAQWALTDKAIGYILDFSKRNEKFNKYFRYVFAPDETYFQTIIHNSPLSKKTFYKGAEPEKRGLENWRNLHYFEYGRSIKIFREEDYNTLINSKCLFFRKATTEESTSLLDKIDSITTQENSIHSDTHIMVTETCGAKETRI